MISIFITNYKSFDIYDNCTILTYGRKKALESAIIQYEDG